MNDVVNFHLLLGLQNARKCPQRPVETLLVGEGSSSILQRLQHTNEGDCDEPSALESETAAEFSCPKMLRTPAVATEFETTVAVEEGMALKSWVFLYFYLGLPRVYIDYRICCC